MKRTVHCFVLLLLICMICFSGNACTNNKELINLNYTNATIEVGETIFLKVSSNSDETIKWITSNFAFASVSNGKVTAKKAGTVTITATQGNASATCNITIKASSMHLNYSSVNLSVKEYISLKVISKSSANVTWRSSNLAVATVSSIGWVTAIKAGTAIITATQDNVKATCIVTVA